MHVARLTEQDWPTLRRERLRALSDAPAAFWAKHADEVDQGEGAWRRFARAAAWFVALDGNHILGLAAGLLRPETPEQPELISMWVQPDARRRGVGSALVNAVAQWATASGAEQLALWVTDGNDAALQLYLAHGFSLTGETAPLPRDPTVFEHRLQVCLGAPALSLIPAPRP